MHWSKGREVALVANDKIISNRAINWWLIGKMQVVSGQSHTIGNLQVVQNLETNVTEVLKEKGKMQVEQQVATMPLSPAGGIGNS